MSGAIAKRGVIAAATVEALGKAIATAFDEEEEGLLFHHELVDGERTPIRVERLIDLGGVVDDVRKKAQELAEAACGRKLKVFKDKVNVKNPGGGHFLAHQDTPAFVPYGDWHISVLVPVTPFTKTNGTLEFALEVPPTSMEKLATLEYTAIEAEPGDAVIFGGLVPHRSGPNTTDKARIGIVYTFVDASAELDRDHYYATKAQGIEGMSLNQVDFTGTLTQ